MSKKNLLLVLVAEQGYIHRMDENEDFIYGNEELFVSISNTYIPLLKLFALLEEEEIPFKLGLVLSAPLCTLLADPQIQKQYIDWLDKCIAFGERELLRNSGNPEILRNVQSCLDKFKNDRHDFIESYGQDLIASFRHFAESGYLELIPTAATYAYLPHYADLKEAINAQIETGLHAHRTFFGTAGDGFFLPYLGWAKGLDKVLRSYNINYTILDTRSLLFAEKPCDTGIFTPVRTSSSLVLFGSDYTTPRDITGEHGFMANPVYRSEQRDAGYELELEDLSVFLGGTTTRLQTGYKYWANKGVYNADAAREQARQDALAFYEAKLEKLSAAEGELGGKDCTLLCTIPAGLLGNSWHEGLWWLEELIRLIAGKKELTLSLCAEHLQNQFSLTKIEPYPCSAEGTGYAETLLNNSNNWMMAYVRKASERMIDLTERFPAETGIKARLLNLGAREVLLAQSSDWPKMINDGQIPEYVKSEFKSNILNFTAVFDSLASNTVSTEWLCNMEKQDSIFPWMNYKVFSKKK